MTKTKRPTRICFLTLGCAKNEVDSDHMTARVADAGYEVVASVEEADIAVVNTCSFIRSAVEESLETIFDLADLERAEGTTTKLVVAGCLPARYGEELSRELPEVDLFIPCAEEENIVRLLATLSESVGMPGLSEPPATLGLSELPATQPELPARQPDPIAMRRVSGYLKIAEGCDRFCSYCTIPFIRGPYRSFTQEEILLEAESLVAQGVRELVLIAQDTGRWGRDLKDTGHRGRDFGQGAHCDFEQGACCDFEQGARTLRPHTLAGLLDLLAGRYPTLWLRVLYLQPEGISDELLRTVAEHDNICQYFDIPLQHCDRDILRSMNRTGSKQEFLALVRRIRRVLPEATLRTTLIAGFPGESEEQFEELCDFVEQASFDYVGVFPYSQEEGTAAADLPEQLDETLRLERAQGLRDLADAISSAHSAGKIGQEIEVLVCGREEDGRIFGRSKAQAPDVDGVVYLSDGEPGEIRRVLVADGFLYDMEEG